MALRPISAPTKPAMWRAVLVFALFVGLGGGTMALLGERPAWPVFAALGLVTALGMVRRSRQASAEEY
jgi:hypothetical protein